MSKDRRKGSSYWIYLRLMTTFSWQHAPLKSHLGPKLWGLEKTLFATFLHQSITFSGFHCFHFQCILEKPRLRPVGPGAHIC